jgi:hypothetical protein
MSLRIYFEPGCKFCSNLFGLLTSFFLIPETETLALSELRDRTDTEAGQRNGLYRPGYVPSKGTRWVAEVDGNFFSNFEGLVQILKQSPLLWPAAYLVTKFDSFLEKFFDVFVHSHSRVSHSPHLDDEDNK